MTTYVFEGYELDTRRHELRHEGALVAVEPQVFSVLAHLAAHADRVVDKEELLDAVWQTRFVSESALTSRIKAARRAIGDDGRAQQAIRTIHGRGYRFVAAVTVRESPVVAAEIDPLLDVELGYCRADDGVRIAYGSTGSGPPLVKAANWLTHLRFDSTSAVWRHWVRDLSRRSRLVRYDERGCGMSDWDVEDVSFDAWVRDLESVVEHLGVRRFALLGISQGGAVAASYAARHPDRVSHLVLYGAFPLGRRVRARSEEEQHDAAIMLDLLEAGWGREDSPFGSMFASQFMPEGSPEQWAAFVEVQRRTTSAHNAKRLMSMSQDIDVTEVAPAVTVPTLVLHATRDRRVPIEQGQLFADLIPGATFVPLESHNHILLGDEPAWKVFVEEVERFISADV
ncbi:MAG TPA: alpha/beta fold hydrolase [Acidimicrobiia bacterium]|nr:alpha/beta fold hydrolase [Acidimicrobiia bacterium]